MSKIRVVNPGRALRRRGRKSKGSSGGGGVFIVAKSKRRNGSTRTRRRNSHRRRRSSNPTFHMSGHSRRHHRRRRNPVGGGGSIRDLGGLVLWGTGGAVATRVVPRMVLGTSDTGFMGYGANAAVALLGGMLVGKMAGSQAGSKFTAGGVISLALRVVSDFFGSSLTGLNGMEYYIENNFPLPTTGQGPYLLNPGYNGAPMMSVQAGPSPVAQAAAAAAAASAAPAGGSMDEPDRWRSRWAN